MHRHRWVNHSCKTTTDTSAFHLMSAKSLYTHQKFTHVQNSLQTCHSLTSQKRRKNKLLTVKRQQSDDKNSDLVLSGVLARVQIQQWNYCFKTLSTTEYNERIKSEIACIMDNEKLEKEIRQGAMCGSHIQGRHSGGATPGPVPCHWKSTSRTWRWDLPVIFE